jgi:hypothetical protein
MRDTSDTLDMARRGPKVGPRLSFRSTQRSPRTYEVLDSSSRRPSLAHPVSRRSPLSPVRRGPHTPGRKDPHGDCRGQPVMAMNQGDGEQGADCLYDQA